MNQLEELMTDVVTLVKPDGTRIEGIKARVSPEQIRTFDASLSVEAEDSIEQQLPDGRTESYFVLDPGYRGGRPPEVPASYSIKVCKSTAVSPEIEATAPKIG